MKEIEEISKKMTKMKKAKRESVETVPKTSKEWLEKAYPPERSRAVKVGGIGYV